MNDPAALPTSLDQAIAAIPPGRWGAAVSGGADSVAMLRLAAGRDDLGLHVIHVDHQTRDGASNRDATFVTALAQQLLLPCSLTTRSQLEAAWTGPTLPGNLSARFRALRLNHFRATCQQHQLAGVLLAHHADDQAETVLLRLLRGTGYAAIGGMSFSGTVQCVQCVRPLLGIRRSALRQFLQSIEQDWREDSSNLSADYARNRVRALLVQQPDLVSALLTVGRTTMALSVWTDVKGPILADTFPLRQAAQLPDILAERAISHWLRRRGVAADDLSPAHVLAVLLMCRDAASAARHALPGGIIVGRRAGMLFSEQPGSGPNASQHHRNEERRE